MMYFVEKPELYLLKRICIWYIFCKILYFEPILNPILKKYQKIIINKKDFSDKEKILSEQKQLN